MPFFALFGLIAALLFPAPAGHLSTSDAAQIIVLPVVSHVAASTTALAAPRRAAPSAQPSIRSNDTPAAAAPMSHTQVAASAAPAAAKTVAPLAVPDSSFSVLESAVIDDINAARTEGGLGALAADSELGSIARAHSADMLAQNYFDHTSPAGCSAVCRYQNAGYAYWIMGENIYWMEGYTLSDTAAAQKVVDAWQNSPGHRQNDLGKFGRIGIGVARSGSRVYVTADFATPR